MTKEEIRDQARLRRQKFFVHQSQKSLEDLEWQRVEALFNLDEAQKTLGEGARVGVYYAMGEEASTTLLIKTLYKNNIPMALPRVMEGRLIFQAYRLEDNLVRSPFGVLEPSVNAPVVTPSLYIVPLLAFDGENHRLGYGKGHYDHYFAERPQKIKKGLKIGWAYECQRVEVLKIDPHDIPLDVVVTGINGQVKVKY